MLQGSGDFQSLRLQLTAGLDEHDNETLTYGDDIVVLPKDHTPRERDPRCAACFAAPVLEAIIWPGIGPAYSWPLCMLLRQPRSSELPPSCCSTGFQLQNLAWWPLPSKVSLWSCGLQGGTLPAGADDNQKAPLLDNFGSEAAAGQ